MKSNSKQTVEQKEKKLRVVIKVLTSVNMIIARYSK